MATLKISDLSVGDWVEYEGLHYPITFVGYGEGGDGSLVNLIRPDLSCFTCKISDIHPIPITTEILEKNGFVKNGEYDEWNIGNWNDIPFIGISLSRQSMRIKNLRTDIFLENKVVYVHQLQCALRLAGVDKKINL
jgi:hypothetical protein